ncbi:MAG: CD3072 family TudS-related putative desulfidase [Lentisphaerota bacterium]
MFNDKRSKKVVLVAHCILNQNAKLDNVANYPGTIKEASEVLLNADIGIIQMPCPELLYLGLDRDVAYGKTHSIESERTRIAERMLEEQAQSLCRKIIEDIIFQITEYQKFCFDIVGLVGFNGSPTCGVEKTWSEGREHKGSGIFIKMLKEELAKRNIDLQMLGISSSDPEEAVSKINILLKI